MVGTLFRLVGWLVCRETRRLTHRTPPRNATQRNAPPQALGRDPRAEGYSGADLSALVREAGVCVLRELRRATGPGLGMGVQGGGQEEQPRLAIGRRHFEDAFSRVPPSVSAKDQRRYLHMRNSLSRARGSASGTEGTGRAAGEEREAGGNGAGGLEE